MADWRWMTLVFQPQLQRKLMCGAKDTFWENTIQLVDKDLLTCFTFSNPSLKSQHFWCSFFQHPRCTISCHANSTGEKHQLIEITSTPVMISPVRSLGFAIQHWWGQSFFSCFFNLCKVFILRKSMFLTRVTVLFNHQPLQWGMIQPFFKRPYCLGMSLKTL